MQETELTKYTDFSHYNKPRTIKEGLESEHRDFFLHVAELSSSNKITAHNFANASKAYIRGGGSWKVIDTLMAEYFSPRADFMRKEDELSKSQDCNAQLRKVIDAIEIIQKEKPTLLR